MSQLIRENVEHLMSKVRDYQERITKHQEQCKHEIVKGEYKADTGNWCKEGDSYWISAVCLDCQKYIYATSDKEEYHKLSNSGMISSEYDSVEKLLQQEMRRREILDNRKRKNEN